MVDRLHNGSPYAIDTLSCPVCNVGVLWPKGWMHQDETWHGGRPWPRPHCVRWGPSSPLKAAHPQFLANACCGQTAGWIKMLLGREVDLGPGHIVFDGYLPLPPQKKRKGHNPSPSFRPMSIVAKRSPISATSEHLLHNLTPHKLGVRASESEAKT